MLAHRSLAALFYKPFPGLLWRMDTSQKELFLTFDDGPFPPLTSQILKILKRHRIPATFFLSGEKIYCYRHQLNRLNYKPHQLGNHFFFHRAPVGFRSGQLKRHLLLTNALIERYFRKKVSFFRPPYGMFGPGTIRALKEIHLGMVLWSLMANDFKWDKQKVLSHLKKNLRPGDIVVFHDNSQTGDFLPELLSDFIEFALREGWIFGKLPSQILVNEKTR